MISLPAASSWLKTLVKFWGTSFKSDYAPETNFTTHSWHKADALFVVTLGMFRRTLAHPLEAANQYLVLSSTSSHIQKCNFIPQVLCEILYFERILYCDLFWDFWTITHEPYFLQTFCFRKKIKKLCHFCTEVKKHIKMDKIFAKTLKAIVWKLHTLNHTLSQDDLNFFLKTGIHDFLNFIV